MKFFFVVSHNATCDHPIHKDVDHERSHSCIY